jgi:hypothetical protein
MAAMQRSAGSSSSLAHDGHCRRSTTTTTTFVHPCPCPIGMMMQHHSLQREPPVLSKAVARTVDDRQLLGRVSLDSMIGGAVAVTHYWVAVGADP